MRTDGVCLYISVVSLGYVWTIRRRCQYETTVQSIKCNMKIIIMIILFNALTEKQAKYHLDW